MNNGVGLYDRLPSGKLFDRPQRDRVLVFDVDAIAGDNRVGVDARFGEFVGGDLFELLASGLEDQQLAVGNQHDEDTAGIDNGAIAGVGAKAATSAALAAKTAAEASFTA